MEQVGSLIPPPAFLLQKKKSTMATAAAALAPATETPAAAAAVPAAIPLRTAYLEYLAVRRAVLVAHAPGMHMKVATRVAAGEWIDRKSTRLNSSHIPLSRMPSSA